MYAYLLALYKTFNCLCFIQLLTRLLKYSKTNKTFIHLQSYHLRSDSYTQHMMCNIPYYILSKLSITRPSDKSNSPPPETARTCIKNPTSREKHNYILPLSLHILPFLSHYHQESQS